MVNSNIRVWDITPRENKSIFLICTALALMRDNSPLFVFTDADSKDADRIQEIIDAAKAKNIAVSSLITSQCTRRKRSALGWYIYDANIYGKTIIVSFCWFQNI